MCIKQGADDDTTLIFSYSRFTLSISAISYLISIFMITMTPATFPLSQNPRVDIVFFASQSTQARLAQSVEHQTFNLRVAGSSPSSGGGSFKRRPMESVSGTLNSLESHCRGPLIPKNQAYLGKNLAPGEARTPDLRISLSVLTYKYDALTDCATGAMLQQNFLTTNLPDSDPFP